MRLGSLFSGAGGLDLAVETHTGARTVWQCEQDPDASKVLAARFGVPNLGDITAVDWTAAEPVDVLCGGFPCQDISNAGKRAGITGARSGLWSSYADAVRVLRPRHVYVENVGALLVRGLGTVLGDLAALGYDASWGCVRASDAGAPHRRERVLIVATDADRVAWAKGRSRPERPGALDQPGKVERAERLHGVALLPTPTAADGERRSLTYCRGNPTLFGAVALLPPPTSRDWKGANQRGDATCLPGAVKLLPTPTVVQGRNATAGRTNADSEHHDGWTLNDITFAGHVSATEWGDYAAAIARWESIIGRPAPSPVDGKGRLSPPFVEWMMGWPSGWVTDLDIKRTAQLRILGNGVVPQQAELAYALLDALAAS